MDSDQNFSSIYAGKLPVAVFLALSLVSAYFGMFRLTVFFAFLVFLFGAAFLWGEKAIDHLEITADAPGRTVFPGAEVPISFQIENRKMLPLVWLELLIPCRQKECISPARAFTVQNYRNRDGLTEKVWRRKFTWILWHQKLSWQTVFLAERRGIFTLNRLKLLSGDGFGLCIREKEESFSSPEEIVVFPALQELDLSFFLKNMVDASSHSGGIYEDPTLLKSIRAYQNGDPLKKINWRVLASQGRLEINVQETMEPRSSFFWLDLESYQQVIPGENEKPDTFCCREEKLEDMLSVLGSLITGLSEREMCCGLLIPKVEVWPEKEGVDRKTAGSAQAENGRKPAGSAQEENGRRPAAEAQEETENSSSAQKQKEAFFRPEEPAPDSQRLFLPSEEEKNRIGMLRALSEIAYHGEPVHVMPEEILHSRHRLGQVYVAVYSRKACTISSLLRRMEDVRITFLCSEESGGTGEFPEICIDRLKKVMTPPVGRCHSDP